VAAFSLLQVGGGEEDRDPLPQEFVQNTPEIPARQGVYAAGGSSRKRTSGVWNQSASQCQLLLHPSGQILRQPILERAQLAELESREILVGRSFWGNLVKIGEEKDVFHDREVAIQGKPLGIYPIRSFKRSDSRVSGWPRIQASPAWDGGCQ